MDGLILLGDTYLLGRKVYEDEALFKLRMGVVCLAAWLLN